MESSLRQSAGLQHPAPINVGSVLQSRTGALNLSGVVQFLGGIIIADGTQDDGRILTSDAAGVAGWKAPDKAIEIEFAQAFGPNYQIAPEKF